MNFKLAMGLGGSSEEPRFYVFQPTLQGDVSFDRRLMQLFRVKNYRRHQDDFGHEAHFVATE